MNSEETQCINDCLHTKSSAAFLRLVIKRTKNNKLEGIEEIGRQADLCPEEIQAALELAADLVTRGVQLNPKPSVATISPVGLVAKKWLLERQERDEKRIQKIIAGIVRPLTLGPRTKERIAKALLDTWRYPDRYSDTPAWKRLTNDSNT